MPDVLTLPAVDTEPFPVGIEVDVNDDVRAEKGLPPRSEQPTFKVSSASREKGTVSVWPNRDGRPINGDNVITAVEVPQNKVTKVGPVVPSNASKVKSQLRPKLNGVLHQP